MDGPLHNDDLLMIAHIFVAFSEKLNFNLNFSMFSFSWPFISKVSLSLEKVTFYKEDTQTFGSAKVPPHAAFFEFLEASLADR